MLGDIGLHSASNTKCWCCQPKGDDNVNLRVPGWHRSDFLHKPHKVQFNCTCYFSASLQLASLVS